MKVTLMQHTSLEVCAFAARTCWQSYKHSDQGGPKAAQLLDTIGNKKKHSSVLEHLYYTFYLQDFSRALLQELARHRIASPSVKSTRYTLKELKEENPFVIVYRPKDNDSSYWFKSIFGACIDNVTIRAAKYLVYTGDVDVDVCSIRALENLRKLIAMGKPNDKAKYALPDAYKTEATWSINARSLQNFLYLRTNKVSALWEIVDLANAVYDALPEDHQYLFNHCVYDPKLEGYPNNDG